MVLHPPTHNYNFSTHTHTHTPFCREMSGTQSLSLCVTFSADDMNYFYHFFFQKIGLTFHEMVSKIGLYKSGTNETICMKCQPLSSEKQDKNINLSSAELSQRVVTVKYVGCTSQLAFFINLQRAVIGPSG